MLKEMGLRAAWTAFSRSQKLTKQQKPAKASKRSLKASGQHASSFSYSLRSRQSKEFGTDAQDLASHRTAAQENAEAPECVDDETVLQYVCRETVELAATEGR